MKIRIAHSPDSDDAFMFYGLASGKVPSPGYELEHVLSDIETLNRAAFDGRYEITAVSFHAYAHLTDRYILRPHGASMGQQNVFVGQMRVSVKRNRGDLVPAVKRRAIQRLDIRQHMFELITRRRHFAAGQAVKHERVVGVGTMGN